MPVFWQHELTGRMRAIVKAFFSERSDLTAEEIDILKKYLAQWIAGMPVQPPRWRQDLAACTTKAELKAYNWKLVNEYGIDAF